MKVVVAPLVPKNELNFSIRSFQIFSNLSYTETLLDWLHVSRRSFIFCEVLALVLRFSVNLKDIKTIRFIYH